jgi:outer membrane protein assembly factor BamB
MFFLDPVDGKQQRLLTPTCLDDQGNSNGIDIDSGLLYLEAENALYLLYDSFFGCVQRLDFTTGQVAWQTRSADGFSFSSNGFNPLLTSTTLYFENGSQLLRMDKATGAIQVLLDNPDYDFVPLAVSRDTLLVRARRTRGTERFEIWGVNPLSGAQLWQKDLQGSAPVDPPDEMSGLVDGTDTGFTWRLVSTGLALVKFQASPNQLVIDTLNPADGSLQGEKTVPMKLVVGDFYSVPTVIGWRGDLVYLNLDSKIYALEVTTGVIQFHY